MNRFVLIFACLLCILSGCVEDKPRPEGSMSVVPLDIVEASESAIEVSSLKQPIDIVVNHHVRGQNIYVECYIPSFTFKEKGGANVNGEGHIQVYVDGKRVDEISTAAFIIKGLEKGKHHLMIEVVHNDSSDYQLKKSWNVNIK
ncbi:hypothetical protein [Bacillus sp. J37]|uniref:hypothetical protein n=1 Tax=Bacillus sp. J37 TaxID=935837 RepID=UPI0004B7CC02|nr:hypothetical protein [Bacillus sp. J37]